MPLTSQLHTHKPKCNYALSVTSNYLYIVTSKVASAAALVPVLLVAELFLVY